MPGMGRHLLRAPVWGVLLVGLAGGCTHTHSHYVPPAVPHELAKVSLPPYVIVLGLCGITTGMGYSLGQIAVQNVLPARRSAEGTSVLLTVMICVGGIGIVAATALIEAVGDGQPTESGIALVLVTVAGVLLLAGLVTLALEAARLGAARSEAR